MTDADVITAIRHRHLKANIDKVHGRECWDEAWLDPGGSIFGAGPYVKLPVDLRLRHGSEGTERVVIRVYPPARLRRRLQKRWVRGGGA